MGNCYRNPARNRSQINDHDDDDTRKSEDSRAMSDNFAYDTLRLDHRNEVPNEVPLLGISLDADQIKYLQQRKSHQWREYGETVAEMANPNNTRSDYRADPDKMRTDQVMSGTARRSSATKHQL